MRLFWVLAGTVLAKTPHSKKDFENLNDEEHKQLDKDVFEFNSEGFDVSLNFKRFNFYLEYGTEYHFILIFTCKIISLINFYYT